MGLIMKKMVSNLIEQEILVLNAANHTLREMHNYTMIQISGDPENGRSLRFESIIARNLYFILMADFLASMREEYQLSKNNLSIVDALLQVVESPRLGTKGAAKHLKSDVVKLRKWLAVEAVIPKMWFPNIDTEINLKISRENIIRICGNLNKHDFLKLSQLIKTIHGIFIKNGVKLTEEEVIMSFEHFDEWFNQNILIYHSTFIAEMLINVQWSIKEYLEPLYNKSLVTYYDERLNLKSYRFEPPKSFGLIKGSFMFHMYWELMNSVRDKPIIEKFTTWKYLKLRY